MVEHIHPLTPKNISQDRLALWWEVHELSRQENTLNIRHEGAQTWNTYSDRQRIEFDQEKREINGQRESIRRQLMEEIANVVSAQLLTEQDWGTPLWYPGKDEEDDNDDFEEKIEDRFDREMLLTYYFYQDTTLMERVETALGENIVERIVRNIAQISAMNSMMIRRLHPEIADPLLIRWEMEKLAIYDKCLTDNPSLLDGEIYIRPRHKNPMRCESLMIQTAEELRRDYLDEDAKQSLLLQGRETTLENIYEIVLHYYDILDDLQKKHALSIKNVLIGAARWVLPI